MLPALPNSIGERYKTLQGEEAREHYSKAVEQTQKELLDDLYKENSKKSIK